MSLRTCPFKKATRFLESDGCPDRECAFWIPRETCCAVILGAEDARNNASKLDEILELLREQGSK